MHRLRYIRHTSTHLPRQDQSRACPLRIEESNRRLEHIQEQRERQGTGGGDPEVFVQLGLSIGLDNDYQNDQQAKKDVIDPSGDAHSVKSGEKKWQIFLYRRSRFETDAGFQALNGIGSLLIHCIDAFPPRFKDYETNKEAAKERLRTPMRESRGTKGTVPLLLVLMMKAMPLVPLDCSE